MCGLGGKSGCKGVKFWTGLKLDVFGLNVLDFAVAGNDEIGARFLISFYQICGYLGYAFHDAIKIIVRGAYEFLFRCCHVE